MSGLSRWEPLSRAVSPPARVSCLRAALCALGLALLAGCSLVPAWQRPGAPLAQSFDGAAGGSLAATVPVRSGWWREYHDPALDALVDRSLRNNFTLASAIASVEQARGNAERAGAPQYPSLSLGATFYRSHQGRGSTTKTQSLFAEASYEVDFWGFNAANASAADLLARASGFDRDTVALTLTASVTDTYFQVQSLRRRLAIARSISDDAAHILQLLLAQQQAGVATELQVQQQRNALATFQAAVPALQQQLDTNMHALAVLAGTAPEQFRVGDAALADIPIPQPRPNLPASLLETRPDIRSKEAQLQSANQSVGAARAAFLPNIVLTADGGLSSKSLSHFLSSPFASLATSLAAPIFDGGALRGQLHASQAAEAKGVADYRQAVITALQDVEDSLTAAQQQQLAEAADQDAADAARKAATLAQAQYKLGTVDFLTVLDAQRTLYQSEDTLVQARLARLQASVSLFRAFGGGFGVTDDSDSSTASTSTSSRS
ncbi:NodT family efflux transporter outer membrane factor (OMF) lipoprotein [Paraburkholderia sp. BL6665CI2N2]|uniref:efflux transporter outer membrane subunit n=1 Tax=Paraburkholderia sp. BL6665CI2N2 TaxID=1938806 RepID=UPI00106645CF|nr:efflux transporter outer membrane subunit [Paraburkholderia sp. BL6665CI2N2]TDY16691.1 NodT family efflux transporter outer membrane factor (OMF) lipoprotein [Paraburkholderia sp. BL6665CI2N2]